MKLINILDGLRVSTFSANFHFWWIILVELETLKCKIFNESAGKMERKMNATDHSILRQVFRNQVQNGSQTSCNKINSMHAYYDYGNLQAGPKDGLWDAFHWVDYWVFCMNHHKIRWQPQPLLRMFFFTLYYVALISMYLFFYLSTMYLFCSYNISKHATRYKHVTCTYYYNAINYV